MGQIALAPFLRGQNFENSVVRTFLLWNRRKRLLRRLTSNRKSPVLFPQFRLCMCIDMAEWSVLIAGIISTFSTSSWIQLVNPNGAVLLGSFVSMQNAWHRDFWFSWYQSSQVKWWTQILDLFKRFFHLRLASGPIQISIKSNIKVATNFPLILIHQAIFEFLRKNA